MAPRLAPAQPPVGTMKYPRPARFFVKLTAFLCLLCTTLACGPAQADEYSDVSQLIRVGNWADAATKTDQFLATRPRDPQMRFLKGTIQQNAGQMPQALQSFLTLTEDYPELPEPYNNLAVLYALQNQFDKARQALEMAIRINPAYATAQENLGDVYAKLAGLAYAKALQLDPGSRNLAGKLGLIGDIVSPKTAAPAK
jgi:Flp pilus assembly protein TadD